MIQCCHSSIICPMQRLLLQRSHGTFPAKAAPQLQLQQHISTHHFRSVPRQKKPQIGYGTMSRGPLKTEIHCEIVEIRIIVDCIKYELNNCNTLSLFIFFILGDLSPRVSRRQQNRFVVFFVVALTSAWHCRTDPKWWVDLDSWTSHFSAE